MKEEQGGGPLIDIGTHALDLTLWMMDNYEVQSVTGASFHKLSDQTDQGNAFGNWDPDKFCVEDSARYQCLIPSNSDNQNPSNNCDGFDTYGLHVSSYIENDTGE